MVKSARLAVYTSKLIVAALLVCTMLRVLGLRIVRHQQLRSNILYFSNKSTGKSRWKNRQFAKNHGNYNDNDDLKASDLGTDSSTPGMKSFSRFGEYENYVAQWQVKGDYYLTFDALRKLNDFLVTHDASRSKVQKKQLLKELSLTYFARFHNLVRQEYQFEKRLVEDRLKNWSDERLRTEGFTLFGLKASLRGNLYQDKVLRLSTADSDSLPFHRFSVGDSIRLSVMAPQRGKRDRRYSFLGSNEKNGGAMDRYDDADAPEVDPRAKKSSKLGPLSESAIDGVVLDRRGKYLEVCIKSTDASSVDARDVLRLDCFVNRVSYERMIDGLQIFLQSYERSGTGNMDADPTGGGISKRSFFVSKTVRDLLLYSYSNSMLRLSRSPGGLKLALPMTLTDSSGAAENERSSNEAAALQSKMEQLLSQRIEGRFPTTLNTRYENALDRHMEGVLLTPTAVDATAADAAVSTVSDIIDELRDGACCLRLVATHYLLSLVEICAFS